jgi:hypothetical protein
MVTRPKLMALRQIARGMTVTLSPGFAMLCRPPPVGSLSGPDLPGIEHVPDRTSGQTDRTPQAVPTGRARCVPDRSVRVRRGTRCHWSDRNPSEEAQ